MQPAMEKSAAGFGGTVFGCVRGRVKQGCSGDTLCVHVRDFRPDMKRNMRVCLCIIFHTTWD
jgi:hypothetical protein